LSSSTLQAGERSTAVRGIAQRCASRSIPTSTAQRYWFLLRIDQGLGEVARPRVLVVLADSAGAFEVREQEAPKELGARSRTERVVAFTDRLRDGPRFTSGA
jgi:hypothetical protein